MRAGLAGGGGVGAGRGAPLTTARDRLLRKASEAAVAVARTGRRADPPVDIPASLRRLLSFARLNDRALATVRRALDDHPEFRERVVASVDEATVGRPGWLWLARPEGWEDELATYEAELDAEADLVAERRQVRRLERALAEAEEATRRAERASRAAVEQAQADRQALDDERRARRRAEDAVRERDLVADRLRDERAEAIRDLKDLEQRHAAIVARARMLEEGSEPGFSRTEVARAVKDARQATEAVVAALDAAEAGLAEVPSADARPGSPTSPGSASPTGRPSVTDGRRRPASLPPATLADSVEAAVHLLRLPKAVALVDGYNVSMAAWGDRPIGEQRTRLVAALDELHARTGVDPVVVFDGVTAGRGPAPPSRAVRIQFTEAGTEADDEVVALVATYPTARPVVVASSDQRVRNEAEAQGANVIGARQLLAVLGR